MASTYSPNLRLELIATGEQSGTWGDTTNTNLGSLLEQAITSVESIPMVDATYTLSSLNGSPDEARNAVIVMTSVGSLTATRNVIVPSTDKLYIFKNATTGGQSLVVKTSTGSGVTVPNGTVTLVYCDGTNVVTGLSHVPSLTLATALAVTSGGTGVTTSTGTGSNVLNTSPTLVTPVLGTPASGTLTNCTGLPVTTGISGLAAGVSTFLTTPSSANLAAAVTDETGSGALVFATSPTLVTPTLGTPASGALTNCTGLPLTTGVTGTLPVANGGTGVTTSTGTGSNVLNTSPTISSPVLTTPVLGTPASGNLSNCTGVSLTTGITGVLPVVNGGTGVTTSTGTGSNVLSASPALTGTPTSPTASAGTNTTQIATTAFVKTAIDGLLESGTTMLFQQTTAPTGWTKSTAHDNKAIRVVSGTAGSGGSVAFTTAFAAGLNAGATTLSIDQMPSHTHYLDTLINPVDNTGTQFYASGNTRSVGSYLGYTGGGGSHAHTLPSFAVAYVDVIIASRN